MARPPSSAEQVVDILLLFDEADDARRLEETFHDALSTATLHIITDSDEAIEFAHRCEEDADLPVPDLILLDWDVSDPGGEVVFTELKTNSPLSRIPVIVLIEPGADHNVTKAYQIGANACISKPLDSDAVNEQLQSIVEFWLSAVHLPPHIDKA